MLKSGGMMAVSKPKKQKNSSMPVKPPKNPRKKTKK